jgi:hypothetical protein
LNTFNQRKGEFVILAAAGTDGITATQIPSLTDITVALISSVTGANGVRLPEGAIGDSVEIIVTSMEGPGSEVYIYHPDQGTFLGALNGGVAVFRRLPDSGGSISWMMISKLQ